MREVDEALLGGAAMGVLGQVRRAIAQGADLEVKDAGGFTALWHAMGRSDIQMMVDLHRAGARNDVVSGDCPMVRFAIHRGEKTLAACLAIGMDPKLVYRPGEIPDRKLAAVLAMSRLEAAAWSGWVPLVVYLMDEDASEPVDTHEIERVLQLAKANRRHDVADALAVELARRVARVAVRETQQGAAP